MAFYPQLTPTAKSRAMTSVFLGYQRALRIPAGEQPKSGSSTMAWYDMRNMSGENYPLITTRHKRSIADELDNEPMGMIAKSALAYIDGTTLYYNNYATSLTLSSPTIKTDATAPTSIVGDYWLSPDGVTYKCIQSYTAGTSTPFEDYWAETTYPHKQLVSMGAYLCIFPDKKYLNTTNINDYGSMEAHWNGTSGTVYYKLCTQEAADITAAVGASPPVTPANGDYWIDTSGNFDVLNRYSALSDTWAQVPTTYVKISCTGIGAGFNEGDGVVISGCAAGSGTVAAQISALNGSFTLVAVGSDYIVVEGILDDNTQTQTLSSSAAVSVDRNIPDMDFVCEAGNRLWGCKYGRVGGETVNELYACALGDFRNWSQYKGLSTDSWAATCGTDGMWTGAVNYFGSPTFFKEDHIHIISISATGAHSVTDYAFEGCAKGCWESLKVVGSTLFYKSKRHVCAYQGGMPSVVSDDLGELLDYTEAAGGGWGNLYYLSMRCRTGDDAGWHLFVFDSAKGLWHREDELHCVCFAEADGDLFTLTVTQDGSNLIALRGTQGTQETDIGGWYLRSGLMTLEYPDQKYVTRYDLRCFGTGTLTVKVIYGGLYTGTMEQEYSLDFGDDGSVKNRTIPVRLHRCDTVTLELSGDGEFGLYSIARILEQGSDYNR